MWSAGIRVVPRAYFCPVPFAGNGGGTGLFSLRGSWDRRDKAPSGRDRPAAGFPNSKRKGEAMREQLEKIREEALNQIEASEALEKLNEIRVA